MSLSPSTVAGTHWTHKEYLLNELLMTRQSNGATLRNLFLLSGQTSSPQSLGLEKSLTHCIKPQLSLFGPKRSQAKGCDGSWPPITTPEHTQAEALLVTVTPSLTQLSIIYPRMELQP